MTQQFHGTKQFYDFSNGDLRRANTPKVTYSETAQDMQYQQLVDRYCKVVDKYNSMVDQLLEEKPLPAPKLIVQEPMTLERAVEILNERKHRGVDDWLLREGDEPVYHHDNYNEYSQFEVFAIARAYLEGK